MAPVDFDAGEGTEGIAEHCSVASILKNPTVLQQQVQALASKAEPAERFVVVKPDLRNLDNRDVAVVHTSGERRVQVNCIIPPAELDGCMLTTTK